MANITQVKGHRGVAKAILIVVVSFVIGHYLYSDSMREYEQNQGLTPNEYVEDFYEYKEHQDESVEPPPGALWSYILFTLVLLSLFVALYELAGMGIGWSVRRIHDSAAGESHEQGREKMYALDNIPQRLQARVNGELGPMEVIRWIEQPIPRYFTTKAKGFFFFGIPWTAFAIFWTCGAAGFELPDFSEGIKGVELFPLFGIPFILIGLGMLTSPLWAYRSAFKTVYVITDLRAITFDGGRSTVIRSYPPEKLQDVYRKENRDGTGDVIISTRTWRDSDDQQHSEELGFLRIGDPKTVEHMLKDLAEQRPGAGRQ